MMHDLWSKLTALLNKSPSDPDVGRFIASLGTKSIVDEVEFCWTFGAPELGIVVQAQRCGPDNEKVIQHIVLCVATLHDVPFVAGVTSSDSIDDVRKKMPIAPSGEFVQNQCPILSYNMEGVTYSFHFDYADGQRLSVVGVNLNHDKLLARWA